MIPWEEDLFHRAPEEDPGAYPPDRCVVEEVIFRDGGTSRLARVGSVGLQELSEESLFIRLPDGGEWGLWRVQAEQLGRALLEWAETGHLPPPGSSPALPRGFAPHPDMEPSGR